MPTATLPPLPTAIRITCNQNKIFGCGRRATAYPTYRRLAGGAVIQLAITRCPCHLTLTKVRTIHPRKATEPAIDTDSKGE